jgi:hypothetical protein
LGRQIGWSAIWQSINKREAIEFDRVLPLTHDAKLDGVAESGAFGVDGRAGVAAGMQTRDTPDD